MQQIQVNNLTQKSLNESSYFNKYCDIIQQVEQKKRDLIQQQQLNNIKLKNQLFRQQFEQTLLSLN